MARTARLTVEIDGRGARSSASGINSELDRLKGNARGVTREFDLLSRAMAAAFAYFGGRELLRFADTATQVRSRLAALSSSTQELAKHQQTVFDISQRTRSELDATSTLYATLTRSGQDLGLQQAQIARITETVNKSFAITGTDGNTASQAIRQLGQAFQSGVLRGDEFNTMAEAAPVLMDALARSLGKPRSELRALAEDGKLTTDQLVKAFSDPRITAGIDEQFAKITPTVQQRLTQLSNAAIVAIGKFDEATGITQGLGAAIGFLTDNMDRLVPIIFSLGAAYVTKLVVGAIQARLAISATTAAAAGATGPLATLGFTARAAGASLLAAFGGPIGIAITGVALGLGYLAGESAAADARLSELALGVANVDQRLLEMKQRAESAGGSTAFMGETAVSQVSPLTKLIGSVRDTGNMYLFLADAATQAAAAMALTNIKKAQDANTNIQQTRLSNQALSLSGNPVAQVVSYFLGGTNARSDEKYLNDEIISKERAFLDALRDPNNRPKSDTGGGIGGGDPDKKKAGSGGRSDNAANEAKRLAEFSRQATSEIARMREQYDGTASGISQANAAHERLNALAQELRERKPPGYEQQIEQLNAIAPLIDKSIAQPFDSIILQQERQIELSKLSRDGKFAEAEQLEVQFQLMDQMGVKSEEQLALALAKAGVTEKDYKRLIEYLGVQRLITQEDERRKSIIRDQLDQVQQIRENLEQTIAELPSQSLNAIGNFFEDLFGQFKQFFARSVVDTLFGDTFAELQAEINGSPIAASEKRVATANTRYADSITKTSDALYDLAKAARAGANGVSGAPAANDNAPLASDEAPLSDTIDVMGSAIVRPLVNGFNASLTERFDVFGRTFTKLAERFLGEGSPLAKDIGKFVGGALEGAAFGQFAGSAFGRTGGKVGGVIGGLLGGANTLLGANSPLQGIVSALPQVGAALQLNQTVGKLFGAGQIKNGSLLTAIIGGPLTALLGSALRGSATIGSVNGELGITGTRGNSKSRIAASRETANSVIDQLRSIADQLGVEIDASAGSASVGIRKKTYVLDPTGQGRTKGAGTIKLGKGEAGAAAAARALALDLINDGVLVGLRAGSQQLLKNASSLEAGLSKALKFENVFRELREIDDPVGAAVEALNREFEGLIKIFKEAGATTAEFADLERLYQIKREKAITEANDRLLGTLKDYLFDLTAGNSSPLSPQLRYQNSLAELNRLDALRASGATVDPSQYRAVADAFLAASRDYQGSTVGYFEDFRRVTSTIESWIASEQARASTTLPSIDFTPLTNAVNNQTNVTTALLQQISNNIAAAINNGGFAAANENYYPTMPNAGGYSRYLSNY